MMVLDDPFREVHRARARVVVTRLVVAATTLAVGAGLVSFADVAPPSPVGAVSASALTAPIEPRPTPAPVDRAPVDDVLEPSTIPSVPAAATVEQPAPPSPVVAVPAGPASWSINIDTIGYQAEIDQCLWVRMNLGGDAPIVGAHNYCGGSIVLEMALGDEVAVAGAELDAVYVVTDARDARAGDSAPAAIDGMVADVVLQTCYWGGAGRVRLVGVTRVPVA